MPPKRPWFGLIGRPPRSGKWGTELVAGAVLLVWAVRGRRPSLFSPATNFLWGGFRFLWGEIMGLNINALRTDPVASTEGKWFEVVPGEPTSGRLLIAHADNRKYQQKLRALMAKHTRQIQRKDEAAYELIERLQIEAMAETILLDWEYVEFNGENTPYSPRAALDALTVPEFKRMVDDFSNDFAAFRLQEEEDAVKN